MWEVAVDFDQFTSTSAYLLLPQAYSSLIHKEYHSWQGPKYVSWKRQPPDVFCKKKSVLRPATLLEKRLQRRLLNFRNF